jgi:DNA-binding NarL/FixJ family response regulator
VSKQILLAEDHPMTRMGLKLLLQQDPDFAIAAEAENGQQVLTLLEHAPIDLVLMDIGMPTMDGIEATQRLKQRFPGLPVLMLTSKDDPQEVRAAMAAGADGYCLKGMDADGLKQAMTAVAEGNVWLDRQVARMVLADLQNPPKQAPGTGYQANSLLAPNGSNTSTPAECPLTEREMEILRLVVDGLSNQQISEKLYISLATTKSHIHNILQKLCLDDRTQAAVWAMRNGHA